MAEDTAKWGGLQLEIPPPVLEPIITAVNNALEMLVVVLDIVLTVLDIVKVFIVGLLSPLLAILDAIIALIESLANDLRKLGLYIHYDAILGEPPDKFIELAESQLKGGFNAWETRCFNWLIDTRDPNRPDFSTGTGTLGLFFYASVEFDGLLRLYKMFLALKRLFDGKSNNNMLQSPNNLKYEMKRLGGVFGLTKIGIDEMWGEQDPPSVAGLSWGYSAAPAGPLGVALPALPPEAVVIELSTIPEGLMVGYSRQAQGTTDAQKRKSGFAQAPLSVGGGPLRIYGGTANLVQGSKLMGGGPIGKVPIAHQQAGIWFVKSASDQDPIFLEEWIAAENEIGKPIGQTQIVRNYGNGLNAFFPDFSYDLMAEDCPRGIKEISNGKPVPENEPAREVFIRISSANAEVATQSPRFNTSSNDNNGISGYAIKDLNDVSKPVITKMFPQNATRSMPSAPIKVKFPSGVEKKFMRMVRNAACIAYLCRGDKGSGFEQITPKLQKYIIKNPYTKTNRGSSRAIIGKAARNLSEDFDNLVGVLPDLVLEALVEAHEENLNFTLADLTAQSKTNSGVGGLKLTTEDTEDLYAHCLMKNDTGNVLGVHINRDSASKKRDTVANANLMKWVGKGGRGTNLKTVTGGRPYASATISSISNQLPIWIGWKSTVGDPPQALEDWTEDKFVAFYAREMFTLDQINSALTILNIATQLNDGKSSWIAIRPLDTLLLPVELFLENLLGFMKNLREGLLAIIQQILDYIRMVEARIVELQQLVRRIQALLRMFSDFVVSADLHMLVVTGAGTQGLTTEFMTAEEKPTDLPTAYGTGVVVVAGGLPLIIVDLLKAIFKPGDKPGGGAAAEGAGGPSAAELLEGEA